VASILQKELYSNDHVYVVVVVVVVVCCCLLLFLLHCMLLYYIFCLRTKRLIWAAKVFVWRSEQLIYIYKYLIECSYVHEFLGLGRQCFAPYDTFFNFFKNHHISIIFATVTMTHV
jgi:hypothetical protein